MSGRLIRARAMVSRRRIPPESRSTRSSRLVGQLGELEQLVGPLHGPRGAAGRSSARRRAGSRAPSGRRRGCRPGARRPAGRGPAGPSRAGSRPEDPQRTRRGRRHGGEHAHGRALAGTVRPQQAEGLAPADGQVDAPHRLERRRRPSAARSPDHHRRRGGGRGGRGPGVVHGLTIIGKHDLSNRNCRCYGRRRMTMTVELLLRPADAVPDRRTIAPPRGRPPPTSAPRGPRRFDRARSTPARAAEVSGFDGVVLPFDPAGDDPLVAATALAAGRPARIRIIQRGAALGVDRPCTRPSWR